MKISHKSDLLALNTMGFSCIADCLIQLESVDDLVKLSATLAGSPYVIIGQGSNLLLPASLHKTVIHPSFKGIKLVEENADSCLVEVAAGENWHDAVLWSVHHNLWGLENLALIPGSVGAAPVQNIGAYGVELKDVLEYVNFYQLDEGKQIRFYNKDCQFGYRDSRFKSELRNKVLITSIGIKLSKVAQPRLNYGPLTKLKMLAEKKQLTVDQVVQTVINIRQQKLPDPAILGNAGSFFKNPIVTDKQYQDLIQLYPELVAYPVEGSSDIKWKLAAGWLIEKAGFKGYRCGAVGVHQDQALVLVHFGGGSCEQLLQLSKEIQSRIFELFQISLEREVRLLESD